MESYIVTLRGGETLTRDELLKRFDECKTEYQEGILLLSIIYLKPIKDGKNTIK